MFDNMPDCPPGLSGDFFKKHALSSQTAHVGLLSVYMKKNRLVVDRQESNLRTAFETNLRN